VRRRKYRRPGALTYRMGSNCQKLGWWRAVGSSHDPQPELGPVMAVGLLLFTLGALLMLPAAATGGFPSNGQFVAYATGSLLVGVAIALLREGHRSSTRVPHRRHRW
jgi:hypothetical protein